MNDVDLKKKKTVCLIMVWMVIIFIPLYWWHEPVRQKAAIARIKKAAVNRGADIYVSNCAPCHGNTGDSIQGKNLRQTTIDEAILIKVIARGRTEAGMPAWGNTEGGSLKNFEIADVVTFIRNWDQALFDVAATRLAPKTASSPGTGPTASVIDSKTAATPQSEEIPKNK